MSTCSHALVYLDCYETVTEREDHDGQHRLRRLRGFRGSGTSFGAPSASGEGGGGHLLPVHGGHIRELGIARTGHQGRPQLERWAVLGLLGAGIANALPLAIAAGGNAPGETLATAAARVSTLGYLGSFVGPVLVGGLASLSSLPFALGLPALLVLVTALGARVVRRAG